MLDALLLREQVRFKLRPKTVCAACGILDLVHMSLCYLTNDQTWSRKRQNVVYFSNKLYIIYNKKCH